MPNSETGGIYQGGVHLSYTHREVYTRVVYTSLIHTGRHIPGWVSSVTLREAYTRVGIPLSHPGRHERLPRASFNGPERKGRLPRASFNGPERY